MKRILARSALTVLFFSTLTFPAHSIMDGSSAATAFTHIGMVNDPADQITGYYYFNLSGNIIRTYVQDDGSVIVLRDYGGGTVELPVKSDWYASSLGRFILPSTALAAMDDINRLKISTGPLISAKHKVTGDRLLDAVTTHQDLIDRVKANKALHRGYPADNLINESWADTDPAKATNSGFLREDANCSGSADPTLARRVFHTCGNVLGTHFIPASSPLAYQRPKNDAQLTSTQFYSLAVLAAPVAIPGPTGSGADFDKLVVTKTSDKSGVAVSVGNEITYSYVITNYTADVITNISMTDNHNGLGTAPEPDIETVTITDIGVSGDTFNKNTTDDLWDALGPGDILTFETKKYTVIQADIDQLQ